MIIVGVDPDSTAHGVAVFDNGELIELHCMTLPEIVELNFFNADLFSIENVCANNAVFGKKLTGKGASDRSIARRLGMVQQAQAELERFLDVHGIAYTQHRISATFKSAKGANGRALFERLTGWTGRSNEDTRSAAYFGLIEVQRHGGR